MTTPETIAKSRRATALRKVDRLQRRIVAAHRRFLADVLSAGASHPALVYGGYMPRKPIDDALRELRQRLLLLTRPAMVELVNDGHQTGKAMIAAGMKNHGRGRQQESVQEVWTPEDREKYKREYVKKRRESHAASVKAKRTNKPEDHAEASRAHKDTADAARKAGMPNRAARHELVARGHEASGTSITNRLAMGTRSPEFKAWFGDWEAASLSNSIRSVRGSDQARQAAKAFLNKPLKNHDSGLVATVSGESLGKMLSKSAFARSVSPLAHMQAVANLDKLFPLSLKRQTRQPNEGTAVVQQMHHFEVPMPFGKEVLSVKILAKEFTDPRHGTRLYLVRAVEIEKPASIGGITTSPKAMPASVPPAGFSHKLTTMIAAVKGEGTSKVVDTQGKPLVVYHGTNSRQDFHRFMGGQPQQGFSNVTGQGFYFTDSAERAHSYAEGPRSTPGSRKNDWSGHDQRIMPVYLNIRNPMVVDAQGKSWRETMKDIVDKAKGAGHDGVIVRNCRDPGAGQASEVGRAGGLKDYEGPLSTDYTSTT